MKEKPNIMVEGISVSPLLDSFAQFEEFRHNTGSPAVLSSQLRSK